jgi:hypothetical protein
LAVEGASLRQVAAVSGSRAERHAVADLTEPLFTA